MKINKSLFLLLAIVFLCSAAWAEEKKSSDKPEAGDRLYTAPDPAAGGGIEGRVARPSRPIEAVLALPFSDPARVYFGEITGKDGRSFRFAGLPMDRYGLIVIYDDAMYEGLTLHWDESTLTADDLKGINDTIQRCDPFFSHKIIHRLEGTTGRGGGARAICTFYRDALAEAYLFEERFGYRRTFKLIVLQQVGPGWQIARARDLYPVWITPDRQTVKYVYKEALSGVRVTDSRKNIGDLMLED